MLPNLLRGTYSERSRASYPSSINHHLRSLAFILSELHSHLFQPFPTLRLLLHEAVAAPHTSAYCLSWKPEHLFPCAPHPGLSSSLQLLDLPSVSQRILSSGHILPSEMLQLLWDFLHPFAPSGRVICGSPAERSGLKMTQIPLEKWASVLQAVVSGRASCS